MELIYAEGTLRETLIDLVKQSHACVILAGAGMGVDSGLTTFRGQLGLWSEYPLAKQNQFCIQDMANSKNYVRYLDLIPPFYRSRLDHYRRVDPHQGFTHLLNYVETLPGSYFVITSNVDGHFQKAGFEPSRIYEVHGSINQWQCTSRQCSIEQESEGLLDAALILASDLSDNTSNAYCRQCGSIMRPNLLMFQDSEWFSMPYDLQEVKANRYLKWLQSNFCGQTLVVEIGAGSTLRTIRTMSETIAFDLETKLVRITPQDLEETERNDPDIINLRMDAMEGIELLLTL